MDDETLQLVWEVGDGEARSMRVLFTCLIAGMVVTVVATQALPGGSEDSVNPARSAVASGSLIVSLFVPMFLILKRSRIIKRLLLDRLAGVPTKRLIEESRMWPKYALSLVAKLLRLRAWLDDDKAAVAFLRNMDWRNERESRTRPYTELEAGMRSRSSEGQNQGPKLIALTALAVVGMLVTVGVMYVGYLRDLRVAAGDIPYQPRSAFAQAVIMSGLAVTYLSILAAALVANPCRKIPPVRFESSFTELVDLWVAGDPCAHGRMIRFARLRGAKSNEQDHMRALGLDLWDTPFRLSDLWPLFRIDDYRRKR